MVGCLILLGLINCAQADCEGSDMSDGEYCLYSGGFGVAGGSMGEDSFKMAQADMYPFQRGSTVNDLENWHQIANGYYDDGYDFRQSLMLIDVVPDNSTALGRMLLDPGLNYETAGLLADFADIETRLSIAKDTYAYHLFMQYPDKATATEKLLNTIKELSTIYLMIGDEFLIDALEFRFSAKALTPDRKLDDQIALLEKAETYYKKALMFFISGFSPAVGTTIYASDVYDQPVIELFNLSLERLSMTLHEKSSRQLVRQMSPDPSQEWNIARQSALSTIKKITTTAYVSTVVAADRANKNDLDFKGLGGDKLALALKNVMRQGQIYSAGLNPLGYDNRYVPMNDFENLYSLAYAWFQSADAAKNDFDVQSREFDSNVDRLRDQIAVLNNSYVSQLSSLTGCSFPGDSQDPDQADAFLECTGEAGGDLFDCSLELSPADFESCVSGKNTGGVLAMKYRNIKDAQARLIQARLRRDNILTKIEQQNERNDKLVEIKRSFLGAHTVLLDTYYKKLKNARTETDSVTYTTAREKDDNGKWGEKRKTKTHTTTETFHIRDDTLKLNTQKEKELLKLTSDFEIQQTNMNTAYTIKDLLLAEAEAEIDIALAAQQKNAALADFDNTFMEKENTWFLYQKALDQLKYYSERIPTRRLLMSQEAVHLTETLNYTAHYAYLAAKALEYKYLNPLVDVSVGGGHLMLTDLFKAQTPSDMETFLLKLNSYNTEKCPWGTFDPQYHTISLATHILGLVGVPADVKRQKILAFINEHITDDGKLEFSVSLSEDHSFLASSGLYNLKIWNGTAPSPCGSLTGDVKGVSVTIRTTQIGNIRPRIRLKQAGHSSFRDATGDILEYMPIYDFHLLPEQSSDFIPYKQAEFIPYVNVDPRYESGTGAWTGQFKGRGISSSEWSVTLYDWNTLYAKTDFSKITDILIHIDTIGQCCYN
jgi:hypothetical protein